MPGDTDETPETLEPISYLSRSGNRLQVLEALTVTIPKPGLDTPGFEPRELRDMTGASEATVSRILTEFQERGWAERNVKGQYTATPFGQGIAIEFVPLLDSMEALHHLGDAVALLPLTELTIGLQHFSDATVRKPEGPPDMWFGQYFMDLLDDASRYHLLAYIPTAPSFEDDLASTITERAKRGTLDSVQIVPKNIHEYRIATFGGDGLKASLDAGVHILIYDGHIPCNLMVFDETVVIENAQVQGLRDGTVIESQNEVVREWALHLIDRYREQSEDVTDEDLAD